MGAIALPLFVAGVQDALNGFRWWQGFHAWRATDEAPPLSDLRELIQPLGPAIWYLVLGTACSLAATLLIRGQSQVPTGVSRTSKTAIGFSVVVLLSEAMRLFGGAPELITREWRNPDSFASISGTIGDEGGNPISGVEVEIFRENESGDIKQPSELDFTDARGAYIFKRLQLGTYVLGVHCYGAPDGKSPYARTFYPGVESERVAERIAAIPRAPKVLNQLRLRRLRSATINIEVRWKDGSRPQRSYLDFHNMSYPNQAVIGNVAHGVDNGIGEIMVPEDFVYDAQATVSCNAGNTVETRASQPIRRIAVASGTTPRRLVFVIPGPRCELWPPKEFGTRRQQGRH